MTQDEAETTAIQALGWIASDPEMMSRFLGLTGLDPSQVRNAAGEPGFLAGVLDFILGHEPSVLAFSAEIGIDPAETAQARAVLAGPQPGPGDFV